jgi:hypothetical protein
MTRRTNSLKISKLKNKKSLVTKILIFLKLKKQSYLHKNVHIVQKEKAQRLVIKMIHNRFLQKFKERVSFLYLIKRHIKRRKNVSKITIQEISFLAGQRAIPLLICILSFPTAIPIPYPPGFIVTIGIISMILSFQLILGCKTPKLPKFIMSFAIKKHLLSLIVEKFQAMIFKSRKFIRQRAVIFAENEIALRLAGLWMFVLGFFLFLPIPFTNVPLGIGITLMCLGIIMKDGLIVLFSIIPGVIGVIMCISAFTLMKVAIVKFFLYFHDKILFLFY